MGACPELCVPFTPPEIVCETEALGPGVGEGPAGVVEMVPACPGMGEGVACLLRALRARNASSCNQVLLGLRSRLALVRGRQHVQKTSSSAGTICTRLNAKGRKAGNTD